jgi:transcriptional regulator of acetoin/glycerol metabolism
VLFRSGTTAIGTTLAELQPVWLHRGEHFFDATSIYSCAGAPIWGPTGECVGMLDLTGVNVQEQPALKHLVTRSARHIENALVLAQPHSFVLRINWPGAQMGSESDGLVTLDDHGHITGCNRHAAELLYLPAGSFPKWANDVFATDWGTLADAARMPTHPINVPLWSGLHMQVLVQRQSTAPLRWTVASTQGRCLKEVETDLIRRAVDDARGNVADAARSLGISRATIYRKLGRHHTP